MYGRPTRLRVALGAFNLLGAAAPGTPRGILRTRLLRSLGISVGSNTVIGTGFSCYRPEGIRIGDFVRVGDNARLYNFAEMEVGDFCTFAQDVVLVNGWHSKVTFEPRAGALTLGRSVWLGARCTLVGAIRLGDYSVAGAGAVVTKDVPPYAVVAGCPARVVGHREPSQRQWLAPGLYYDRDTFALEDESWTGQAGEPYTLRQLKWLNSPRDIAPPDFTRALATDAVIVDGLYLGRGWHALETDGTQSWRWVASGAEIVVLNRSATTRVLSLDLEPGPSLGAPDLSLRIVDAERGEVGQVTTSQRCTVSIPLPGGSRTMVLRLEPESQNLPVPRDPRVLNLRVFAFGWAEA